MDNIFDNLIFSALFFSTLSYLTGSFSTAIITCKIMGIEDPRTTGSNNPGATNVLRHGGKKAAIITLIGDLLKGLIPVLIVIQLQLDTTVVALTALFALIGHIFPVYYNFKGGKGVATYYGAIFAINWQLGLIATAIWLATAAVFKISSLSALLVLFCSPFILWHFSHSVALTTAVALMSAIVFWRHKKNIKAMLQGSEAKIGKTTK